MTWNAKKMCNKRKTRLYGMKKITQKKTKRNKAMYSMKATNDLEDSVGKTITDAIQGTASQDECPDILKSEVLHAIKSA